MSSWLPMAMEPYSICAQPTVTYTSEIVSSKKKRRHRLPDGARAAPSASYHLPVACLPPIARHLRVLRLLGPELHSSSYGSTKTKMIHTYATNAERTLSSHARVAAVPRDEQIPTTVDLPTRRDDTDSRTQRIQPQVDDFSSVCQLPPPCHGRSS